MRHAVISVPFELKQLSESGEFSGVASPYGVRDLGNDIVDPGAFTKTIAERGNKVRLLDGHEVRIGVAVVKDSSAALEMTGKINLDKQAGRDAYSDLKFYRDHGQPMGLSIGYETLKSEPPNSTTDGARHLKEVRLWEISITEFPMAETALVSSVKRASRKEDREMERKMTFDEALGEIQTWSARYDYMQALDCAICEAIYDEALATPDAVAMVEASVAQFQQKMVDLLPKLRALMNSTYGMDFKRLRDLDKKEGRRHSAGDRAKIESAIEQLQALLAEEAAESEDAGKSAAGSEAKSTSNAGAADSQPEPEQLHSAAEILKSMRSSLIAA